MRVILLTCIAMFGQWQKGEHKADELPGPAGNYVDVREGQSQLSTFRPVGLHRRWLAVPISDVCSEQSADVSQLP